MKSKLAYRVSFVVVGVLCVLFSILASTKVIPLPSSVKSDFWFFLFLVLAGFGLLNLVFGMISNFKMLIFSSAFLITGASIYALIVFTALAWYLILMISIIIFAVVSLLMFIRSKGVPFDLADNEKAGYKKYVRKNKGEPFDLADNEKEDYKKNNREDKDK